MGGKIICSFFRKVVLVFKLKSDGGIVECWVGIRNSTKHPPSIRVQVLKFIIAVLPKINQILKIWYTQYFWKVKYQVPRKPLVLSLKLIGCLRFWKNQNQQLSDSEIFWNLKPLLTKWNTHQSIIQRAAVCFFSCDFQIKLEMILVLGFSKKHLEYKFFFPEAWQWSY